MQKTIAVLIDIELDDKNTFEEKFNEYICTEFGWLSDSGMRLKAFSDVPNDTTIDEIKNAIVLNRSEQIEEEYAEAFEELS